MEDSNKKYNSQDFANIDFQREARTGQPEVVYCQGKTAEQITSIFEMIAQAGNNVLGTKASEEQYKHVSDCIENIVYNPLAKTLQLIQKPFSETSSYIAIVAAGTSDLPVVEEAFETARFLGNRVVKIVDVGVAGIHRLFDKLDIIRGAKVVIVVAGMEGALASVVGGLVSSPVIAVPTSVGYGAGFNGISALLSMLNSCTTLSVVNIDNGYGAACQASRINQL